MKSLPYGSLRIVTVLSLFLFAMIFSTSCPVPAHTLPRDEYQVSFDANGGYGSMAGFSMFAGTTSELPACDFLNTKQINLTQNFIFSGWSTSPSGSVEYIDKSSWEMGSSDVVLYAVWVPDPGSTLLFSVNGGTGTPPAGASLLFPGDTYTIPVNTLTRSTALDSYTFTGWSTNSAGPVEYADGADFDLTVPGDVLLYAIWEADSTYSIIFNGNGGTGTMVNISGLFDTYSYTVPSTGFSKIGYTFGGWATSLTNAVNGLAAYADSASVPIVGSNITLYAVWTANPTRTVLFDQNSGFGVAHTQQILEGVTVNLDANTYTYSSNYFYGWSVTPAPAFGQTPDYGDGAVYTAGASDQTLYAIWSNNALATITFHSQHNTTETSAQNIPVNTSANLSGKPGTWLKTGFYFAGWSNIFGGTTVDYLDGGLYSVVDSTPKDLYAIWNINPDYTISFNANGGMGSAMTQDVQAEITVNLSSNTYTRTGYTFAGWSNTPAGGVVYADGASYTIGHGNITLYAVWTPNANGSVIFNKDDPAATGTMGNQLISRGLTAPLDGNGFSRTGYTFAGWSDISGGSVIYSNGALYVMGSSDINLYAVWNPNVCAIYYDTNGGVMVDPVFSSADYDSFLTAPTVPTRAGFIFQGWFEDDDTFVNPWVFATEKVSGDHTFYVKWANTGGISATMIPVDGGLYTQSLPLGGGYLHSVPNYSIGQFEVTYKLWNDVKAVAIGYTFTNAGSGPEDYAPVSNINWFDTVAWCNAYSERDGYTPVYYSDAGLTLVYKNSGSATIYDNRNANGYRLPTEAEWHYGATDKGQLSVSFAAGATADVADPQATGNVAWYTANVPSAQQQIVGSRIPNSLGLYDMSGNVFEWCSDFFAGYPAGPEVNYSGPVTGTTRVIRGGAWNGSSTDIQSGARSAQLPSYIGGDTGFRVARTLGFSVRFNSNTVDTVYNMPTDTIVSGGSATTAPTVNPGRLGYAFDSWCLDSGGVTSHNFSSGITGDLTLYAKWISQTYNVTLVYNNGNVNGTLSGVSYYSVATAPAIPVYTGYSFNGWFVDNGTWAIPWVFATDNVMGDMSLYGKWTANNYSMSFNSNGGSAVTSISSPFDQIITEPLSPSLVNNSFLGWYTDDGTFIDKWNFALDKMPIGGITLYARWAPATCTVTFNANGGTGIPASAFGLEGYTIGNPGTPIKGGYTFVGWYEDNTTFTIPWNIATDILTGPITLYAKWSEETYGITYNLGEDGVNGGGNPATYTVTTPNIILTAPTRTGYTFLGWFTDAGYSTPLTGSEISTGSTGDITLFAQWSIPVSYNIIYNNLLGGINTSNPASYTVLTPSQPLAPASRAGYIFNGWYDGATPVLSFGGGSVGDITIDATWTLETYSIDYFNIEDLNVLDPTLISYDATDSFSINLPTAATVSRDGYVFGGWFTDPAFGGVVKTQIGSVADGDLQLYAKWIATPYTITYDFQGGVTPTIANPTTYNRDMLSLTLNAPTFSGKVFVGWYNVAAATGGINYDMITDPTFGDLTLYARWEDPYTPSIGYTLNGGVLGGISPFTYKASDIPVAIPLPTKTGYSFVKWIGTYGTPTTTVDPLPGDTISIFYNEDLTLEAIWVINSYDLSYYDNKPVTSPGGDTVTGSSAGTTSIAYDSSLNYATAPSLPGHSFDGWNTQANGLGATYGVTTAFNMPAANVDLYAMWTVLPYNLSYDGNKPVTSPGGDTVSGLVGLVAYDYNSPITTALIPTLAGHTFTGWNSDSGGGGDAYAANTGYTMPSINTILYAQWTVDSYNLIYDDNKPAGAPGTITGSATGTTAIAYNALLNYANAPSLTGYTFDVWNTQVNGGGIDYTPSTAFNMGAADLTLYGKWAVKQHDIIYDENRPASSPGGDPLLSVPGSVTVDYNSANNTSSSVPTLTGHLFSHWDTAADGSGADYGSNVPLPSMPDNDMILYAGWTVNSHNLIFNGNKPATSPGGDSVTSVSGTVAFDYYSTPTITLTEPTLTGHIFSHWDTAANGSGADYAPGATLPVMPDNDFNIYAIWTVNAYTVSYDDNRANSNARPVDLVGGIVADSNVNYNAFFNTAATPTLNGHTFDGWSTSPAGPVDYAVGTSVTMGAGNLTLYAQWTPISYSVYYNPNDPTYGVGSVTGTMTSSDGGPYNVPITLSANTFSYSGYSFAGWNTQPDGSGDSYTNGGSYTPLQTTTLRAQWTPNGPYITNIYFEGTPAGTHFTTGETIIIVVEFDLSVSLSGNMTMDFDIGGVTKTAYHTAPTGNIIRFNYVVQSGDNDLNGASISAGQLSFGSMGMSLTNSGNDAILYHPEVADDLSFTVDAP